MGLVGLAAYAFFVASLLFSGVSELQRKDPRAMLIAVFGLMPDLSSTHVPVRRRAHDGARARSSHEGMRAAPP
jgi:hypothetical protein